MHKPKRLNNRISVAVHIFGVTLITWLAIACPREAISAEVTAEESAANPSLLSQVQLAPVRFRPRFGGNVDYTMRRDTIAGRTSSSRALTMALNTGVDFNSFFWQPWLAQVGGGLGVSTYLTDNDYSSAGGSSSNKTISSVVTGKAALDIVPQSRFPFRAFVERDDNRQNVGFGSANSATQATRFGLSQRYRTLNGKTNYQANYNQSRWESVRSGIDQQKQLGLEMATTLSANQSLNLSGNRTLNERLGSIQRTVSDTAVARHSYRPRPSMTVDNLANVGRTKYRLVQGENQDKFTQLSSFASWTSTEKPLTVTGGARYSEFNNSTPLASARQSNANANIGASYQVSKKVRTYASASVNLTEDKNRNTRSTSTNQAAGANYRSDMTQVGTFSYSTHASGNVSNSTAPTGNMQGVGLSAGHGLTRSIRQSPRVQQSMNLDQTVSTNKTTRNPATTRLTHSGSVGWSIAGDGGITGLRANASDSRSLSAQRDFFQLINLQLTRSENMSRNTSLEGNLTAQATRQGAANTPSSPTALTSSASLNYTHQRVFSVPRLNFNSEVRVYSDSLLPLSGGAQDRQSSSWGNHLRYSIGRLQLMLDANLAQSNNVSQSSLIFRLSRAF